MNSLNKAQIIGNITRDPELRQTKNGQSVCTLGVATNRRWNDSTGEFRAEAEFHNVVCWGKLAEIAEQLLKKGTKVFFEGRLQTRNWEDEAGVKHYRTEVVAQDMIVLHNRRESTAGETVEDASTSESTPREGEKEMPAEISEEATEESKKKEEEKEKVAEDLPF